MDVIDTFKQKAKIVWADFASMENLTGTAAPTLVKFAGITTKDKVLDVACGTGVVALTAARCGATVIGTDLTPQLIERAKENAKICNLSADFYESDVESLPFRDNSFDIVVSQFGHMFAPRPNVALGEMMRVLKPNGTIAFATWPPELFMGKFFKLNSKYGPPLPKEVSSPVLWGNIDEVTKRLSPFVQNLIFDRDRIMLQGLSVNHLRHIFETSTGPLKKMMTLLSNEPQKLNSIRSELDKIISDYFHNNQLKLDFLLTKGYKARTAKN